MTLGSLFDGSGGFPLAGVINGITPVWASEIEPFPIRVTKQRFPDMKHLGSVTDINGAEIEPVDVITFGSPCQDLSVAGKQAGIHEGKRSNLFFEAIRIIREMREATNERYPRYAVWENVPGAFSSNKGADFRAVLQALCKISDPGADVPEPPKGGWKHAGCVVGDGYSVAWRVYDAQYWGVPQRRKRIYLVADFGSERAGEILFERESVRGDSAESGAAREGAAADAEGGAGGSCGVRLTDKGYVYGFAWANAATAGLSLGEGSSPPIKAAPGGTPGIVYSVKGNCVDRNAGQNGRPYSENTMFTLNTMDRHAVAYGCDLYNGAVTGDVAAPLCANTGASASHAGPSVCYPNVARSLCARSDSSPCLDRGQEVVCYRNAGYAGMTEGVGTLRANGGDNGGGSETIIMERTYYTQQRVGEYVRCGVSHTLMAKDYKSASDLVVDRKQRKYIVRRLTPTEYARLQGFPDWWTDGADGSDSAIYKMWGNGIALPCAVDVLRRIVRNTYQWLDSILND